VNERKVADVKKVLDDARRTCLHAVRPRDLHLICRIIEQLELWNSPGTASEADPDNAIGFHRAKCVHACLFRRNLLGVRRHEHAPPILAIRPAVIRTLEAAAADDGAK
jgi:hypothetical protein